MAAIPPSRAGAALAPVRGNQGGPKEGGLNVGQPQGLDM